MFIQKVVQDFIKIVVVGEKWIMTRTLYLNQF